VGGGEVFGERMESSAPFDPTAPEISTVVPMIVGTTLDDADMRVSFEINDTDLRRLAERRFAERAKRS